MSARTEVVKEYFASQSASDVEAVVSLFAEDAEVHNVNFPPVFGKGGVRSFCEDLYSRTSARSFEVLDMVEGENVVFAEWQVRMTFRAGAKIGQWELAEPFDAELRGVNKFEFAPGSNLIRSLRIYHQTSTVAQLAQTHAKKS